MNHFSLFAHGPDFQPDEYLAHSSLQFDNVWRRGDPRGCSHNDSHPTSGIEKFLGDGRALTIYEQDATAVAFLERHQQAIAELSTYPGVESCVLGLHHRLVSSPSLRGFCFSASPQLMGLSLRTGVDLTFYVELEPSEEWEE